MNMIMTNVTGHKLLESFRSLVRLFTCVFLSFFCNFAFYYVFALSGFYRQPTIQRFHLEGRAKAIVHQTNIETVP